MRLFKLLLLAVAVRAGAQSHPVAPPQIAPPSTAGPVGVRAGYAIEPESVHVGDPVIIRVVITAPLGTKIFFPPAIDSTAAVEPLDPVVVKEETKDGKLQATALYRFLAWELGLPVVAMQPIRIEQDGKVQELSLGDPRVFVMTVLPRDTAQRIPKPSRDIAIIPQINWQWWVLIVVGFTIAIALGVWLQRRQRRPKPAVPAHIEAHREFGRLMALDLIGAGEPAKHVSAAADVLRAFLAKRKESARLGLTTAELLAVLEEEKTIPVHRIREVLETADAVKFAGAAIDPASAEAIGAEASAIVKEIHRVDEAASKR